MKIPTSVSMLFTRYVFYTLAFTLILSPFAYIASVYATPIYGVFPVNGFYKMSKYKTVDRGQIGFSSQRALDANITGAADKIRSSTKGLSDMPITFWPKGYDLVPISWNNTASTWTSYTDIMFTWANRGTDSGGQTYPEKPSSAFCTFWKQTTYCGWRQRIQFDNTKWANASSTSKQRYVLHETGHAVGMKDYCTVDSIMNNGAQPTTTSSGCNSGKWTAVMSYQPTDRAAVKSIYPQ
jgi:hypothetical protein